MGFRIIIQTLKSHSLILLKSFRVKHHSEATASSMRPFQADNNMLKVL